MVKNIECQLAIDKLLIFIKNYLSTVSRILIAYGVILIRYRKCRLIIKLL